MGVRSQPKASLGRAGKCDTGPARSRGVKAGNDLLGLGYILFCFGEFLEDLETGFLCAALAVLEPYL